MECEKVDAAHKSQLCLTAVPCQEEASVLLSLEFCGIIFFPFLFVIIGDLWDLLWESYQVFGDKIWIHFPWSCG